MAHPVRERYWSAVIADFRRSGLTQAEFCHRRHISIHSFRSQLYSSRHRLPAPGTPPAPSAPSLPTTVPAATPSFLPVHVRPQSPLVQGLSHHVSRHPAVLELVVADEHLVRIPVGFDPLTLHQLLEVLKEWS
jgi:hypothetical protein